MAGHDLWPFGAASMLMKFTYFGSFAVLLAALWRLAGTGWGHQPQLAIIGWIMLGLAVNAAVSGVIGGVFDRYQGRVAWLVPLIAVAALAMVRRRRTTAVGSKS
jgi:MYXO-CTERM domain-containing protein